MNIGNWSEFWEVFKLFITGTDTGLGYFSVADRIIKVFFDIKVFGISIMVWGLFCFFVTILVSYLKGVSK